jgi:tetratricopeptide (TPR) repeat protein
LIRQSRRKADSPTGELAESFADYSETSDRIYSWFFIGIDFLVLFSQAKSTIIIFILRFNDEMKRIYLSVIFLFLCFITISAGEWDDYFKNANQAYSEGKYQEAISNYENIIKLGKESGEVYFNLANSYYKMDEIGQAILYYEKAAHYLEGDEALAQNLKIARLKIVDKIQPIPRLFIVEWWEKILHSFSINVYAWLSLGLFTFLLLFIILYVIFNKYILRKFVWILSVLFIIILTLFISRIYESETQKFAIILADKVSVAGEPNLNSTEVFILHEGTKVQIIRTIGDWAEITIADGKAGWLRLNSLGVI